MSADDLREILRERPDNFDELVRVEKRRIRERGFVQFLSRGQLIRISLSERAEQRRIRQRVTP